MQQQLEAVHNAVRVPRNVQPTNEFCGNGKSITKLFWPLFPLQRHAAVLKPPDQPDDDGDVGPAPSLTRRPQLALVLLQARPEAGLPQEESRWVGGRTRPPRDRVVGDRTGRDRMLGVRRWQRQAAAREPPVSRRHPR